MMRIYLAAHEKMRIDPGTTSDGTYYLVRAILSLYFRIQPGAQSMFKFGKYRDSQSSCTHTHVDATFGERMG
ncbi:hypothetical protein LSH36_262g02015 [Paralvinella palmiformis]|uniref:Uncharacterized protein n=1 Tax=Paralvinella palmiformis TaxID=53620 RepID=A0AAD9JK95_9ANNE|nr:hypothetical protein LSH36_262g02015 [Paralvinella palmiformis]